MYLGALIARNINDQNATNIDLQHNSYKKTINLYWNMQRVLKESNFTTSAPFKILSHMMYPCISAQDTFEFYLHLHLILNGLFA